ncbi:MAG: DUF420 domain-containing protein [Balneolaceae bacterium]|nr:DUF420 domain-containing protein [Balneolaceae bacterium]
MESRLEKELTVQFLKEISVKKAIALILVVSGAAFFFLLYLLYVSDSTGATESWVQQLPALNAFLNSITTVLILSGYAAIRKKKYKVHMRFMLTAFITSSLFLISYLVYHHYAGDTPFPGQGWVRPVYFAILISHIFLSAFVVPLVLTSYYFAFSGKFKTHRKVSKWTFPIWLYVSVTGVVIFFFLNAYT